MKSKTELFKRLSDHFDKGLPHIGSHSISDETYGKRSFLYFYNLQRIWGMTRKQFESMLTIWGYKVNSNWSIDSDATEVQVSYFKGHNWDV